MIESYGFGKMVIDGKTHTNDVKIFPSEVKGEWWRDEGHLLQLQDIEDVLEEEPELVVIGQGYHGRMKIDPEVKNVLKAKGIEVISAKSREAVKEFNEAETSDKVGLFHLTC